MASYESIQGGGLWCHYESIQGGVCGAIMRVSREGFVVPL